MYYDNRCPALIEYRKALVFHLIEKNLLPNQCQIPRVFRSRMNQVQSVVQSVSAVKNLPTFQANNNTNSNPSAPRSQYTSALPGAVPPMNYASATSNFALLPLPLAAAPAVRSVSSNFVSPDSFNMLLQKLNNLHIENSKLLVSISQQIKTMNMSGQCVERKLDQITQVVNSIIISRHATVPVLYW
ncbi:unnamed protein product [Didymodactylos carnosus]|uniref:Uncharacterized protein n=1 Tax=Didymodactylos carnosus TaxID=1234261 RepID=A0A815Y1U6_9BILA|nr:unnamed protein product [Didymodactylos carnosus]CAF1564984.1 unnamed protein product [Didymodactylos carnosus]CAF4235768.1 unnamed protein product [Didymodactylos carnosus]CAF4426984.1 unnamed protein product [Didymodactylos carnosus]